MEYINYASYGSNLNLQSMALMTPNAKCIDKGYLKDYKLVFHSGLADIIEEEGSFVPVAIYKIPKQEIKNVDRYEGYPRLYHKIKKDIKVLNKDKTINCMIYKMQEKGLSLVPPNTSYYETIKQGYEDWKLENLDYYLKKALVESMQSQKGVI